MTYSEAIQFLYGLQLFGAKLGLTTTRQLEQAAGRPQQSLRFIHVAGTNGKGSTCAMLESVYRHAGLRVGLYTSPHLVSFRERIQVNRVLIPEAEVVRLVSDAQRWIAELPEETHPTFFEVITVIAMRYFADQRCDLVIWETGLGGRLDATNIVTPLASVITNIQKDHEKWLGDTIPEIAREKAGIIKPSVPVLTAAEDPAALQVIKEVATAEASPLHIVADPDFQLVPASLALAGAHQRRNAALALKTIEVLQGALSVNRSAIDAGLAQVRWDGRFQEVRRGGQTFIFDGAHNPAGAKALAQTARERFGDRGCTMVLGVLQDKNWQAVCESVAPLATRIIVARVASARTTEPAELASVCQRANPAAEIVQAPDLNAALRAAGSDPFVLVTGSLYFVGEAMEALGFGDAKGERSLNEWTKPQAPIPAQKA